MRFRLDFRGPSGEGVVWIFVMNFFFTSSVGLESTYFFSDFEFLHSNFIEGEGGAKLVDFFSEDT